MGLGNQLVVLYLETTILYHPRNTDPEHQPQREVVAEGVMKSDVVLLFEIALEIAPQPRFAACLWIHEGRMKLGCYAKGPCIFGLYHLPHFCRVLGLHWTTYPVLKLACDLQVLNLYHIDSWLIWPATEAAAPEF